MTGTPPASDTVDTAVYLYGVARDLDPAALRGAAGVAGTPVRGVVAGGLTAVVSTVRLADYGETALRDNLEDLAWLEATARAHHEVVDRAAHAAPTAPVRIATIYRDDARVAEVLAAQRARFGEVLDRISGRSEWRRAVWPWGFPRGSFARWMASRRCSPRCLRIGGRRSRRARAGARSMWRGMSRRGCWWSRCGRRGGLSPRTIPTGARWPVRTRWRAGARCAPG